jgi:anti-sigma B factor antagonist
VRIDVAHVHGLTVVAPEGELDARTSAEIKDALADLVQQGHTRLIVDLGHVPYVDSSGLGAIVAAMKRARAAQGDLMLCALQNEVRLILELTGLTKQMAVHPGRQEAMASWRSSPMAPPLEIDQTVFLVSTRDPRLGWTTVASDVVPFRPGRASYRWRIRLRTPDVASVAAKEVFTAPAPPSVWPSDPDIRIENERRTAIAESRTDVTNGWVSRGWRVVEGDQPGEYSIDVHLNGAFVHRFVFHVR